jgi:hypothetical protein
LGDVRLAIESGVSAALRKCLRLGRVEV